MENQKEERTKFMHLKTRYRVEFFKNNEKILTELSNNVKMIETPMLYDFHFHFDGNYQDILMVSYFPNDNSVIKELMDVSKNNDKNILMRIVLVDGHFNELLAWELKNCYIKYIDASNLETGNHSSLELNITVSYSSVDLIYQGAN